MTIQLRSEPLVNACEECSRVPTGKGDDQLYTLINGDELQQLCDLDLKDVLLDLVLHNDSVTFDRHENEIRLG